MIAAAGGRGRGQHRGRGPDPPRRRQGLPGPDPDAQRPARERSRRRRSRLPTPPQVAAVARGLRGRGRRRRAVRRRHQRRRRGRARARPLRPPRLARPDRPARSSTVDPRRDDGASGPRPARAGGRGRAQRRGLHARATSRSPTATRRSAATPRPAPPGRPRAATGASTRSSTEIELTAPAGPTADARRPRTRPPGPALRELVLGSEGTLGVITDVAVRVRPLPERKRYEGWFAPGFADGIEIVRALAQGGALPDVVRLSDREETRVSLAMSGLAGAKRSGARRLPAAPRPQRGLHADRRLGGRARGRRAPPPALTATAAQRRRRPARSDRPAAPGSRAASRAPTSATS